VRGRAGSGRRALAAALAQRAGRALRLIIASSASASAVEALRHDLREVHLRGWIPCVSGLDDLAAADAAAREEVSRAIERHPGPMFVRCGAAATPAIGAGQIAIDLPTLSVGERTAAWSDALARTGLDAGARELAERYPIGAGRIFRIASDVARGGGRRDGSSHTSIGCSRTSAPRGSLASGTASIASPASPISCCPRTCSTACAADRAHPAALDRARGLGHGADRVDRPRGDRAVQGGPGTGKTLVAGVVARELGYELYRVDLSRVTSKWLGETEKNLAEVFDAAEDGRCILLFDEADSLFARRTAVRTSNDRHANLEVNYLLQRLDTFEGIAILTTNASSSIDPAFKRRLSFRLSFPFPDEDTREQLWRAHLPPRLPVAGPLALDRLAHKYQLSGGYIRNAALRAAYLAAARQAR
jgi:hypothetical protein